LEYEKNLKLFFSVNKRVYNEEKLNFN
jgi:hypothetical protein